MSVVKLAQARELLTKVAEECSNVNPTWTLRGHCPIHTVETYPARHPLGHLKSDLRSEAAVAYAVFAVLYLSLDRQAIRRLSTENGTIWRVIDSSFSGNPHREIARVALMRRAP